MGPDEQPDGLEEAREPALPVLVQRGDGIALRVGRAVPARGREGGSTLPVVQAAAVAAGSFVAGAAVAGLVHRRQRAKPAVTGGRVARALGRAGGHRAAKGAKGTEVVQIVGSRSLLVDVHLLGLPNSER